MDASMTLEVLTGLLATVLVALVSRPGLSSRIKLALALGMSVVVGLIVEMANVQFDLTHLEGADILTSISAVFITSQAAFLIFKGKLGQLEEATTSKSKDHRDDVQTDASTGANT